MTDRNLRKALIAIALTGLTLGTIAWFVGRDVLANRIWAAGTVPVVTGLAVSMVRDFMAGRMGVDAVGTPGARTAEVEAMRQKIRDGMTGGDEPKPQG
jgi:hypothetical protein